MKLAVYRKAHFNAAHRLHVEDWSDEKNRTVFGPCNNPLYHGHNYDLIVKVVGEVDPVTGFVIDLNVLRDLIKTEVEDVFDHKNLNLEVDYFKDKNPTCENICFIIWKILSDKLGKEYEVTVRLYETARNYCEYPVS